LKNHKFQIQDDMEDISVLLAENPSALILTDINDNILYFNNVVPELFNISPDALFYENAFVGIIGKNPKKWASQKEKILKKGIGTFETRYHKQGGGIIDLEFKCKVVGLKGEKKIILSIRDISDRKIVIKKLLTEQQKNKLILDSIPAMIYVKDTKNHLIGMNHAFEEVSGLNMEMAYGKNLAELSVDQKLAELNWIDDLEVIETGIPKRNIIEPFFANKTHWLITDKIPFKTLDGEIIGIIGFSIDITERKSAEESLLRSEKKFRLLFETAPDGILLGSLDGKLLSANKSFLDMLGYTADEIENMTYYDITHEKYQKEGLNLLRSSIENNIDVGYIEQEYLRKNGSSIPVMITGWIIKDDEGNPAQLGAHVKDLTLEKKAKELEKSLLEKEKEQLEKDLAARNRELNTKVAQLIETNELVNDVISNMESIQSMKDSGKTRAINAVIRDLTNRSKEDFWSQFELTFGQVHQSFYENLFQKYPNLTPNEKKLCAFLKLNLSTKDISSITHQSIRSLEIARSRLRQKMNLDRSSNLTKYLSKF